VTSAQAACEQDGQVQSAHVQLLQLSLQCAHEHAECLQVGQVQSRQSHTAHESEQLPQLQALHSS
jgi:hypothetical protein